MTQPEYWFYHLEASTLKGVLPDLLTKTLSKGWRALVRFPDGTDLAEWDDYLWTFQDQSFLPHGREDRGRADQQPILLSNATEAASGFDAVFLIDGAALASVEGASRVMVMIDGRSEDAVQRERARWKALKNQDAKMSYWQQTSQGGWEKKA
ncbi:DNA polymerase III subunit chi [Algimonas porphyrae]|uniref:DNA polymerase III subunit chi n=1 Tax=Algimonas porphyrae TaxID=1128113 RepID=A0ABQ5UYX8_9PROT|nr:DNA polymerase III subunit chi [Algimonas porphyrae]GLQ19922.1 DNA polymerase III subunit chi [Algimonas porphyrae]